MLKLPSLPTKTSVKHQKTAINHQDSDPSPEFQILESHKNHQEDNAENSTLKAGLSEELQSIQEFILSKYYGEKQIFSTDTGFLLGLPRELEHIQAILLSQTVQGQNNTYKLLDESFQYSDVLGRSYAKFHVHTLNIALKNKLTAKERIISFCFLNRIYIPLISCFLVIFFSTGFDDFLYQAGILVQVLSIISSFFVLDILAKILTNNKFNSSIGTLVETEQQKQCKAWLAQHPSLTSLQEAITEAEKKLDLLNKDLDSRKDEASKNPKSKEVDVVVYMLLQTAIVSTGESQTNICELIRQTLKKVQEHPRIQKIPIGDNFIKGVMSKARTTFTPSITARGSKDEIATYVRQTIAEEMQSFKITK